MDLLNKPGVPELHQEAQPRSNLTFISPAILLMAARCQFGKQLFTVRDLGQDGGRWMHMAGRTLPTVDGPMGSEPDRSPGTVGIKHPGHVTAVTAE